MRLRAQLVLVSLLMLLLPWAGCQFVIDMDKTLRQGQTLALTATAKAVAARLENDERVLADIGYSLPDATILYAQTASQPMAVDGYSDDWPSSHLLTSDTGQAQLQMAHYGEYLYLLVTVIDSELNYHNPSSGQLISGDYLALRQGEQRYVVRTSAPGQVSVYKETTKGWRRDVSQQGVWIETENGYQLELQIPLPARETPFSLAAVNMPISQSTQSLQWHWFGVPDHKDGTLIRYRSGALDDALAGFTSANLHVTAVDLDGYIAGDAGLIKTQFEVQGQHGLLTWLYTWILRNRDITVLDNGQNRIRLDKTQRQKLLHSGVNSQWYYRGASLVGRSTVPLYDDDLLRGIVMVEQSTSEQLSMTNTAFNRLFLYTFVGLFSVLLLLLAYASWLSFRIRRLSIAAECALQDDGNIKTQLPSVTSADELGDLARSYQTLLEQVQEYTQYLRTLSDKLSHELRTPLAIVKSSLENLDSTANNPQQAVYIERAQSGAARLSSILMAMSSAKRIEESLSDAHIEYCDLHDVLQELHQAYQQAYPATTIRLNTCEAGLPIAADLFVQMLDKLMDNAADFCSDDGAVTISLEQHKSTLRLCVSNDGPLLPEAIQHQLFGSLVSSREGKADSAVHMGLGLHIVKLIAEFHGASVHAYNRADNSGVEFWVTFNT